MKILRKGSIVKFPSAIGFGERWGKEGNTSRQEESVWRNVMLREGDRVIRSAGDWAVPPVLKKLEGGDSGNFKGGRLQSRKRRTACLLGP